MNSSTLNERQRANIVRMNAERDLRNQVAREVTESLLSLHPELTTSEADRVEVTVNVLEGVVLAMQMIGGPQLVASLLRSSFVMIADKDS